MWLVSSISQMPILMPGIMVGRNQSTCSATKHQRGQGVSGGVLVPSRTHKMARRSYRFLLAIGQRTCVWWKCSWCVCSSPPQFYWQDSTPMVCLWEVEQSSGLTPWLFPLQRAGELLCNFPNCIVLFSLFMTAEVPDHLPSFSQPSKKRSSLERPWSSVGQLYDRRIDSEKVSGFTQ